MTKKMTEEMLARYRDLMLFCTNPMAWLEKEEAELRAFEEAWKEE